MSDMQRLMDNLLLRLPGAVESVVRLEIFNALNEFCRETNCWWHRQTIQLQPQQTVVPIFAPMNAETVRIMRVTHDGIPLNAALRALELTMLIAPQRGIEIDLTTSLAPSYDTQYDDPPWVPAEIWKRHYNAIMDGTLARMMSQPAKPYSSMNNAGVHALQFRTAKNDTRSEVDRAFVYDAQNWQYPYFARGR